MATTSDASFDSLGSSGTGPQPRRATPGPGAGRPASRGDDLPAGVTLVAEPSQQVRLAAVRAAQNPLLEAAQPLLRALADMPAALQPAQVTVFLRLLEREVATFQTLCSSAQIKHEHAVAASYALCTAIDEAAGSSSWGGGRSGDATTGDATLGDGHASVGVWAGQQLAAKFHGDTKGGDKVFLLIGRLAASPHDHIDLLEVIYLILGLGFEGRFSSGSGANSRHQLETIRHRLFTLLSAERGDVPTELSAHWRGVGAGKFRLLRSVPVWVTATVLALALLAQFSWYQYELGQASAEVQKRIRAIGAMQAPATPHKSLRLKELLSTEIANGTVSVDEDDRHSAVSFKGDDLFMAGQARVNPKILPVIAKVAVELNEVSGTVQVTGHSDNQPISTREFPDNQVLSEKRAAAVARVLQDKGVEPTRLKVEGRGDTVPLADNATPAGRSRNRRVDIVVTQGAAAAPARATAGGAPPAAAPAR